ncbi:MAG: hypothetical protein ABFR53_03215 [Actinomycetota bacterium]
MRDETGSMLPAFGGLLFVSFVLVTLAVEIGLLGVAYRDTASIADTAAEAGAAMIDVGSLHEGSTVLNSRDAVEEASATLTLSGVSASEASIEVDDATVCVAISRQHAVQALGYLAISTIQIEVTGCAEPATG